MRNVPVFCRGLIPSFCTRTALLRVFPAAEDLVGLQLQQVVWEIMAFAQSWSMLHMAHGMGPGRGAPHIHRKTTSPGGLGHTRS